MSNGYEFMSFAIRGNDVSVHNGPIDWSIVQQLCHFSVIREGYGRVIDARFVENWKAAKGKVNRSVYWYMDYYSNHDSASPVNGMDDAAWGKEQAETCWKNIKDDPEGIVWLDIENGPAKYPRLGAVPERAQTIAKAFLKRIDQLNGKTNGIYCSYGLLTWFYSWFRNRPLWVAWYNDYQTIESVLAAVKATGWTGKVYMWQYTSTGDTDANGTNDGITVFKSGEATMDLNAWTASAFDYAGMFPVDTGTPEDETGSGGGGDVIPEVLTECVVIATATPWLLIRTGPGKLYPAVGHYLPGAPVVIGSVIDGYAEVAGQPDQWVAYSYLENS